MSKKKKTALEIFTEELIMGMRACEYDGSFRAYMNGATAAKVLEEYFKQTGIDVDIVLSDDMDDEKIFMEMKR